MKIISYNLTAVNKTKGQIFREKYTNYKAAKVGFQDYKKRFEGDFCTIEATKVYKNFLGFHEEIIFSTEKDRKGVTFFRGDL